MSERANNKSDLGRPSRSRTPPEIRTQAVRMPTLSEHNSPQWMQPWLTQGRRIGAQASDWVVRDPDTGEYQRFNSDEFIVRFFALSTLRGRQAPLKVQRRDARYHPRPGDVVCTEDEERWVVCRDNRHGASSYYRVNFQQQRGASEQNREIGIDLWRRWARQASRVSFRRLPWRYEYNWPRETIAIVKVTRTVGPGRSDVLTWWELCGGWFQSPQYYPSFGTLEEAASFLNEQGVGNPDVVDTAGHPISK